MDSSKRKEVVWACSAAAAGALVLSLAACEEKPAVVATPQELPKKAAAPAKAPEKQSEEAEKAAREKAAAEAQAAKAKENEALADKVKSAIMAAPGLNKLTLDVTAADGDITLFGSADTRAHRDKAAQAAAKVEGVKSVKNNMAVVAGS